MVCYLVVAPIVLLVSPAALTLPSSTLLSIKLDTIVLSVLFNVRLGVLFKFIMQFDARNL